MRLTTIPLLLASFLAAAPVASSCPQDVDELKATLLKERDDADEALIEQLADAQSRDAMEALLEVYGNMASIWMRREVVTALGRFDGVADAFEPALEKVMNVATEAEEQELRDAALEALGKAREHGKTFLALIVESPAQDDIRIEAMRAHTRLGTDDDKEWYRKQYERTKKDTDDKRAERRNKGKDDEEKELVVARLPQVRRLAMEMVLTDLSEEDLLNDFREDRSLTIKRVALGELHRRQYNRVADLAREILERVDNPGVMRAYCAEIVADIEGADAAKELLDIAGKKPAQTQKVLRDRIADLLVDMNDEKVNKQLLRLVGKGDSVEKAFALRATRHLDDEKLRKSVRKGIKDRDPKIVAATLDAIGARRDTEALKDLEKMLKKADDEPEVLEALLECLSAIHDGSNEWVERLVEYTESEALNVRNAAIYEIGRLGRRTMFDLFVEKLGHENWSTRLAAMRALEALRTTDAIGAIVERLPEETGRMEDLFTDSLWRLTGRPFGSRTSAWTAWWKNEGKDQPPIAEGELEKLELEKEEARLRQISTVAKFFGIQIRSHRVIFIIDTSGSMAETLRTKYVGEQGDTRMEVAKAELKKAVEGLDPTALFNIVIFNSGMDRWRAEGIATKTESTREEALEYVDRLDAGGATNIYGALELAFEDPDVDTIVLLGDGEPTAGDLVDAGLIREAVADWNATRGIQIHTVAVGGSLQLMEWLAEDSGGRYVEFR